MPFQIIYRDITQMDCDAIVDPTDERFSGGGGTDRAIHRAAGPRLDAACKKLGRLRTGSVAVTEAYDLPCRRVIHTVGPVWHGGDRSEENLLRSCYLNALLEAGKLGLSSIAFPLISAGTFGFPKDRVLRIASDAISDFLQTADGELQVYVCIPDRDAYSLRGERELDEYLSGIEAKNAPAAFRSAEPRSENRLPPRESLFRLDSMCCESVPEEYDTLSESAAEPPRQRASGTRRKRKKAESAAVGKVMPDNLGEWLRTRDDSFAVMLLKLIDLKGMTEVQCYKKANVTKGTFWKINNDPKYRPSKATVIAFAVALELSIDETGQLLRTAGYALSDHYIFDKIISYYILRGEYDLYEINEALYKYDQVLLGCG